MTIEQAIRKAYPNQKEMFGGSSFTNWQAYMLHADFWQSLGKALGWSGGTIGVCEGCGERKAKDCNCPDYFAVIDEWVYRWHRFIDHLAQGRSADEFFAALDASTHAEPPTREPGKS